MLKCAVRVLELCTRNVYKYCIYTFIFCCFRIKKEKEIPTKSHFVSKQCWIITCRKCAKQIATTPLMLQNDDNKIIIIKTGDQRSRVTHNWDKWWCQQKITLFYWSKTEHINKVFQSFNRVYVLFISSPFSQTRRRAPSCSWRKSIHLTGLRALILKLKSYIYIRCIQCIYFRILSVHIWLKKKS